MAARIRSSGSVRSAVPGAGVIQPLTHVGEGAPFAAVVSVDVVVCGGVVVSGVVDGGAVVVTASDDIAVEAGGTVVAAGCGTDEAASVVGTSCCRVVSFEAESPHAPSPSAPAAINTNIRRVEPDALRVTSLFMPITPRSLVPRWCSHRSGASTLLEVVSPIPRVQELIGGLPAVVPQLSFLGVGEVEVDHARAAGVDLHRAGLDAGS